MGGNAFKVVEEHHKGKTVKDLAENFVLYGALAEIYAKKNGFNAGLGGSMHTFFKPFGSMPNNAIVGGSGTIAVERRSTRRSTARRESSLPISATVRLPAVRSMKRSSSPRWTSIRPSGTTTRGIRRSS